MKYKTTVDLNSIPDRYKIEKIEMLCAIANELAKLNASLKCVIRNGRLQTSNKYEDR